MLQKVEYFQQKGVTCDYVHYSDVTRSFSLLQLATVLVFYRVPDGKSFDSLMSEASRLGLRVYYDIDDPIFDESTYAQNKNLDVLTSGERSHLLGQIPGYRKVMEQVGNLIVSTEGMKELLIKNTSVDNVLVWPNLIDSASLDSLKQLPELKSKKNTEITIGYFSGSRAHDADFDVVSRVLAELLGLHENLRIFIGGYANLPESLLMFRQRVTFSGFMSYTSYLENMRNVDINIVPLVTDGFNECKSGIRYLEASMCAVPTVASKVGQFRSMISHGVDGMLSSSEDDWRASLQALLVSDELRKKIGCQAEKEVMRTYCINSPKYDYLQSLIVSEKKSG